MITEASDLLRFADAFNLLQRQLKALEQEEEGLTESRAASTSGDENDRSPSSGRNGTPPKLSSSAGASPSAHRTGSDRGAVLPSKPLKEGERTVRFQAAALEAGVAHAAQRHWWEAARAALDLLRDRNHVIGSESRNVVTVLRDEASSVLSLMRQTKMDEATISCAG